MFDILCMQCADVLLSQASGFVVKNLQNVEGHLFEISKRESCEREEDHMSILQNSN